MFLLGLAGGCAVQSGAAMYTRPTPSQVASAESTVSAAHSVGADQNSTAAPFLAAADRELANGKQHMNQGDNQSAHWMLQRAMADAELSRALVQRAHQEGEAKSSEAQLRQARETMARPATPETTPESATPQTPAD
jgi:hypothetical protein